MSNLQAVRPTICRDCVFAEYNERSEQTDCRFNNRLWNLEKNGAKLTRIQEDGTSYYQIEDRHCSACHNVDSVYLKDIPKKNWKTHIEELIRLRLTYIIVCKTEVGLENTLKTIKQAEEQTPKPHSLLIVFPPSETPTFDSVDVVDYLKSRSIRYWSIEHLEIEKAIKVTERAKRVGIHHTIFFAGADIPADFSHRINLALNYDMVRFIGLRPDSSGNGMVLQTGAPLAELIERDGIEHYIKRWEDL